MSGGISALAFCWKIERQDGAGIALTSHDESVEREGIAYRPDPGVIPAAITRSLGLEPHSAEVAGALSSEALTERDLQLGRWDGARIMLAAIDWQDEAVEPTRLIGGELGEVSLKDTSFSVELRGAASRLLEPICPTTSPECRAQLGDKKCRVNLAGRSVRAKVVAVEGLWIQTDVPLDERFLFGRLRHVSGDNCGASSVILGVDGNKVRVRDLPRVSVVSGCVIELREGCDKRFETCVTRFRNAANFRGEPHLPGNDLLTRYPGA
ncbi:MAG: DUF2163 domain-containing protein [Sphingomonas sp.]|nr:DUF2163 domain-containing protein [Sphingomonas sp.]